MNTEEAIKYLLKENEELRMEINSLKSSTSIPLDISRALAVRLGSLTVSSKAASSEQQAVNEGASAQYTVAKAMDGFKQAIVDGQVIHIPFYL